MPSDPSTPQPVALYDVPPEGSLGLLALGYRGLEAWRARRDGRPATPEAAAPTRALAPSRAPSGRRVLLVGWDAADWKPIRPLLDAGQMPALERLLARGVWGNLATLDPPLSPMLWTSIATGKTADQHGVLGFVQPTEDGTALRPVLGTARRVKALWNILSQEGLRSNVVGWWPSHPAEPIRGAMVSNFFQRSIKEPGAATPLPDGTVHPPEFAEPLAACRLHPAELTAAHLLPFVPHAAEVDQEKDRRLASLARILSDCASVQAAATWLMEHTDWDLTAVYFDAIDHFGHAFMKYHPPRMAKVSEEDFRLYQGVVAAGYRLHDMMLDRLLDLAGEDATVILLSDHGFHSDRLRPTEIPQIPTGPAVEHRAFGVLAMAGPGLRQNEVLYGSSLLNVTPTVLTLLGLPVGRDMPAPPLVQAFEEPPVVPYVESWEAAVPGEAGQHPPEAQADPWAEQEAMRQLVELGYVEPAEGDTAARLDRARRDARFNLARVYLSTVRPELAVPILEELYAEESRLRYYYGFWLAQAYRGAGRVEQALATAEWLQAKIEGPSPALDLLLARLHLQLGDTEAALAELERARRDHPRSVATLVALGDAYLLARRADEAERVFRETLDVDPDSALGYNGLAKALIARKEYGGATDAALGAVALLYHFPEAHFHLGVAMTRLGWAERAEQAFLVSLAQAPETALPHRWLARLYRDYLRRPRAAAHHWARYRELSAAGPAEPTAAPAPPSDPAVEGETRGHEERT